MRMARWRARAASNDRALAAMLDNDFFVRAPPKSLDRLDFGIDAVEGLVAGRWRRHADGVHRGIHRARARTFPRTADDMDRLRRRAAQSRADGRIARARERAGAVGGRRGLARRFHRGRSVRLSRGALAQGPAAQPADHDRRSRADDAAGSFTRRSRSSVLRRRRHAHAPSPHRLRPIPELRLRACRRSGWRLRSCRR